MNKLKIVPILFSITILALLVTGCSGDKATGGGWFIGTETNATIDTEGNYVTFGFNIQPDLDDEPVFDPSLFPEGALVIDAKGQFQLIDHTWGTRIHGTISTAVIAEDLTITTGESLCMGVCSINGSGSYDGSYTFLLHLTDGAGYDFVNLIVDLDNDGIPNKNVDLFYQGVLGGGAVRIHVN